MRIVYHPKVYTDLSAIMQYYEEVATAAFLRNSAPLKPVRTEVAAHSVRTREGGLKKAGNATGYMLQIHRFIGEVIDKQIEVVNE